MTGAAALIAHGVQGRAETPIPLGAFFVTAALVVVLSFVGLRVAWSRPRWQSQQWRSLPAPISRFLLSPITLGVLRATTLLGLAGTFLAAAVGSTLLNLNIAPLTVFVIWWVGLVPLSLVLGNVWRAVNPWATLARLTGAPSETDRYPRSWGLWPAAILLAIWAWLELVYPTAGEVRVLATLIALYSVATVAAMHRFGVDTWLDHGEVFTVFTGLLASLSPFETRAVQSDDELRDQVGWRAPAVGATRLPEPAGLAGFVGVLVGAVTFDGFSGTGVWKARDVAATERVISLGVPDFEAGLVVATIGLLLTVTGVMAAFEAASWLADRAGRLSKELSTARVAGTFAHSLVPIAAGYHVAHYFTLFVFQSQDLVRLVSDPLGRGADYFGTAAHRIDFTAVSPNSIWTVQIAAIVLAHVLGLVLAHERALVLTRRSDLATRSQYPMLALMVGLTVSGLWFLSEGMTSA